MQCHDSWGEANKKKKLWDEEVNGAVVKPNKMRLYRLLPKDQGRQALLIRQVQELEPFSY